MIFKCYLCKEYKFWNKNCYEVIVTGNDSQYEIFKTKVCGPCGEQVDKVYQAGKQIAELEAINEDDRESNPVSLS